MKLLLTLLITLLASCATLVNGPNQTIPVTTNPPGAIVTEEGTSQSTPATLNLKRNHDYVLTITKEGYETQKVKIVHLVNGVAAGNLFSFGLLGTAIDVATGSCWMLKPENIVVTLRPLSFGEKVSEFSRLNSKTLKNQLAALEQLKEANLLTPNQYEVFRDITIHCVE